MAGGLQHGNCNDIDGVVAGWLLQVGSWSSLTARLLQPQVSCRVWMPMCIVAFIAGSVTCQGSLVLSEAPLHATRRLPYKFGTLLGRSASDRLVSKAAPPEAWLLGIGQAQLLQGWRSLFLQLDRQAAPLAFPTKSGRSVLLRTIVS